MGSLISQAQLDTVTAHVEDAVAKGARVLTGGKARPDLGPFFFEPTILEGVTPDMTCFGRETFGPVVSLYRFHDEADAIARANEGEYGLNASIYSRDGARPARSPCYIKCGTVNINEAFAATFASIDAPMGGMRQSGLGRRQGSEGIHRFTETQSVATQRLLRFGPMLGMSDQAYGKVMTANLRLMKKPRPSMNELDFDVLVVGSGFGGSVTALRLTEKGYRVGVIEAGGALRGRRPARHVLRRDELPLPPRGRLLRHPAHRRPPRLHHRVRGGRGRWLAGLRQHALRAAAGVLRRPAVGAHHRLALGAGAVLRPGQADAGRRREPAAHPSDDVMEKVASEMGVADTFHPAPVGVFFGEPGQAQGERVADPFFGGAGPERTDLHRLRRVHDRVSPQRQEHPGQELPLPRRAERRRRTPAHDRHPGRPARRRRVRRRRPLHQGQAAEPGRPPHPHGRAGRASPPPRSAPSGCCTG